MADVVSMDLRPVEEWIKGLEVSVPRLLRRAEPDVRKLAQFLLTRMRANAPILDGDLRKGLFFEIDVKPKHIEITFGGTEPYTLRRHEEMYHLGPVSLRQPGTPEGGVGRKFMTRVLTRWEKEIADLLVKAILDAMEAEAQL